jgi:hypothetical protein
MVATHWICAVAAQSLEIDHQALLHFTSQLATCRPRHRLHRPSLQPRVTVVLPVQPRVTTVLPVKPRVTTVLPVQPRVTTVLPVQPRVTTVLPVRRNRATAVSKYGEGEVQLSVALWGPTLPNFGEVLQNVVLERFGVFQTGPEHIE